jgi:hypothetical protein
VKTMSMVVAICLVGSLLAAGSYWRAERVRAAYRIRTLHDELAHARNENEWLRGALERKQNPLTIARSAKRLGVSGLVKDVPVVVVPFRDHREAPGS